MLLEKIKIEDFPKFDLDLFCTAVNYFDKKEFYQLDNEEFFAYIAAVGVALLYRKYNIVNNDAFKLLKNDYEIYSKNIQDYLLHLEKVNYRMAGDYIMHLFHNERQPFFFLKVAEDKTNLDKIKEKYTEIKDKCAKK